MKTTTAVVLFLLIAQSVFSQNILKGEIIESNNNQALAFVNVYFPQLEKGTVTDDNGKFQMSNIPNGTHKLVVSSVGFETYSINITFPVSEVLKIILQPSAIEMEEVIISTPFHKLQSENVMKVERQSVKELKSRGAINLADGITNIAGVSSLSTGVSIGKPVIRGLSSNRVLVYTQGVRLENQQYGDEHGLGINDAGIESVEVIKGPASLLYGSDALGGVLYLNPERFATENASEATISGTYFSNTQGYNSSAAFKSSGDHFKFLFRGSVAEHSDYETTDYRVTNTRFREQDFKAGLGYQKHQFKTELRYNINRSKLGIPEAIGIQDTNTTPLELFQEITNHIFSSKSTIFFNNSSLDVTLGYIYNDRKEFEDHHHGEEDHDEDHDDDDHDEEDHDDEVHSEDEAPALHMKLKTFNYNVRYNLPEIGRFETIVGVQGMNQANTNYGEELLIPDAITNDIGILATSHIHFDKIDIQLGARYDYRHININSQIDRDFNSFNGALGIKTNLFHKVTARFNLASGFRAPNLSELASDGTHEGTNRYEIGNIDLKNEQNFQVDLALEFKNEHVEVFANLFYNQINDYIFLSPNGEFIDDDPVFVYLQDNARLYGGEFGFHFHPHPLDWLHVESSFETVIGQLDDDTHLPLIPANSLHNTLRVEFNKDWIQNSYSFIKYSYTFDQNNVSDFESNTAGYGLLSAGLGGTFQLFKNDLEVTIAANNIANTTYVSHLSRLKSDNIFNIGRNISLGLNYTL
ncbi:TonB-dependent receptor [Psychroserpens sp. SPM9]|uniref:TonB-dependent receptor n=1 Tax=Psychroserpens sp. SPM9 TaxID=2975598 RepID=UPI0021A6579D|nr:TonB-dependent receptor [Psychroserpens sp. SPM9]MDG5491926.1 TonB-dependent receptor [Psychroserpens sp. SPM9]